MDILYPETGGSIPSNSGFLIGSTGGGFWKIVQQRIALTGPGGGDLPLKGDALLDFFSLDGQVSFTLFLVRPQSLPTPPVVTLWFGDRSLAANAPPNGSVTTTFGFPVDTTPPVFSGFV
jgi:hypothetical protein